MCKRWDAQPPTKQQVDEMSVVANQWNAEGHHKNAPRFTSQPLRLTMFTSALSVASPAEVGCGMVPPASRLWLWQVLPAHTAK